MRSCLLLGAPSRGSHPCSCSVCPSLPPLPASVGSLLSRLSLPSALVTPLPDPALESAGRLPPSSPGICFLPIVGCEDPAPRQSQLRPTRPHMSIPRRALANSWPSGRVVPSVPAHLGPTGARHLSCCPAHISHETAVGPSHAAQPQPPGSELGSPSCLRDSPQLLVLLVALPRAACEKPRLNRSWK